MNDFEATKQPVTLSEKILWTCAVLAGIAALVVGPIVGGTPSAIIIPLVIAGLITAGASAARSKRLSRSQPAV